MRILFLDDDAARHRKAHQLYGDDAIYVFNYREAVAAFGSASQFDVAYLDHDLIEQTAAVEKTGYDVAKYIVSLPAEQRPKRVIIHSHNELGRERMAELLTKAGCQVSIEPFQI